jgi:hypothetical protein
VVEQVERQPAREPHRAEAACRIDVAARPLGSHVRGDVRQDHDWELESLGAMRGHQPHSLARLLDDRRLRRLTLGTVAEPLDEAAERDAADEAAVLSGTLKPRRLTGGSPRPILASLRAAL